MELNKIFLDYNFSCLDSVYIVLLLLLLLYLYVVCYFSV